MQKALLAAGATLQAFDHDGDSCLHWAASGGHLSAIEHIVGLDPSLLHHKNNQGLTALHFACDKRQLGAINALLAAGADPAALDTVQWSPMHYCCRYGDLPSVKRILEADKDALTRVSTAGSTPLHVACEYGRLDMVEYIVEQGASCTVKNSQERTPLMMACRLGHAAVVKCVLDHAEIDLTEKDEWGYTALHQAIEPGMSLDVVKILLEFGANITAKNEKEEITLHLAVWMQDQTIVKFLLELDPESVNATDTYGNTPLSFACYQNDIPMVSLLLDNGANMKKYSKILISPLHRAIQRGTLDIVKFLVEKGADINHKTSNGITPLHYGARYASLETVKFLVQSGADLMARDNNSWGVIHYAMELEYRKEKDTITIGQALLELGAEVQDFDKARWNLMVDNHEGSPGNKYYLVLED